jgi:uncharacterized membrane protein YkoI
MRKILMGLALLGALEGLAAAKGERRPTVTLAKAQATALARAPGTVKSAELETEHGVLLYSFDIADKNGRVLEVQIDAHSGKVIAVDEETPADEAAERAKEAKERK